MSVCVVCLSVGPKGEADKAPHPLAIWPRLRRQFPPRNPRRPSESSAGEHREISVGLKPRHPGRLLRASEYAMVPTTVPTTPP